MRAQLVATLARGARLAAEQDGASEPAPDDLLAEAATDPATQELMDSERRSMVARQQALADQLAMRDGKIAQARADLASSEGRSPASTGRSS